MSFGGQSSQEKQRSSQVGQSATSLGTAGETSLARGGKAFKMFRKAGTKAEDFWSNILKGGRGKLEEFFAPEANAITGGAAAQKRNVAEFGPRGGATPSAMSAIDTKSAGALTDVIAKARPEAAAHEESLAQLFAGAGAAQEGLGLSALSSSADVNLKLNEEMERIRARQAQMFEGIGGAVGEVAGSIFSK